MNQLALNKAPKNQDPACGALMTMAEKSWQHSSAR
jgi:hypothetical protein